MAITRRADYAVRLMYELAQLPEGASLSLRDLCEVASVPSSFAEPLVQFLVDAGFVRQSGARKQLLALTVAASDISMADIVRVAEPTFSLSPCVTSPESCPRSERCGVHRMWTGLDRLVWQELEKTTLAAVSSSSPTVGAQPGQNVVAAGLLGTA